MPETLFKVDLTKPMSDHFLLGHNSAVRGDRASNLFAATPPRTPQRTTLDARSLTGDKRCGLDKENLGDCDAIWAVSLVRSP
jgi:hypothetical protein